MRPVPRRAAALVVALLTATVLAACSDTDEDPTPRATTTPTATRDSAEVPQAQGLSRIDVDGPPGSPVTWRLPSGTTPEDPVGVAQRFITLFELAGTPGTDADPALATSVADGAYLSTLRLRLEDPTRQERTPARGPLRVWLDDAETRGDLAVVRGCADVGRFRPRADTVGRAQAWYTELRRVEDSDGRTVWKVSRYNAGPPRDGQPFEARCRGWADHDG